MTRLTEAPAPYGHERRPPTVPDRNLGVGDQLPVLAPTPAAVKKQATATVRRYITDPAERRDLLRMLYAPSRLNRGGDPLQPAEPGR